MNQGSLGKDLRLWIFVAGVVLSGLVHWGTGRWQVRLEPDSASYLQFDWSTTETILRGIRTPGYPLFLEAAQGVFGLSSVPGLQWFALVAAVTIWCYGLLRFGFTQRAALWTSMPLLFSSATWDMGGSIGSDSLGMTLCIAGCGFFMAAISEPSRWIAWWMLAIATLLAILVRPAYLFLVPLWPILTLWIVGVILRRSRRIVMRKTLIAGLASILPFLGYCGLRSAVVGEFGVVSFAGYNLIGITGQFLNEDDLSKLQNPQRELAEKMIKNRERIVDYAPPESYETMVRLYNATAWGTAAPAADEMFGSDAQASNAILQSLAMQALRMHRMQYLKWLLENGKSLIDQLLIGAFSNYGSRLAILATTIILIWHLLIPTSVGRQFPGLSNESRSEQIRLSTQLQVLWWFCFVFVCGKGLLVILVEPALGRYVAAVGCLIPALVGWICGYLTDSVVLTKPSDH